MIEILAKGFIERASTLGYKGRRRDDAALDYFVGAAKALYAAGCPQANIVAATAEFIIASRGFEAIEELAKGEN